jgi:hypothetical protein
MIAELNPQDQPAPQERLGWFSRMFYVPMHPARLGAFRIAMALVALRMLWFGQFLAVPLGVGNIPRGVAKVVGASWPLFALFGTPPDWVLEAMRIWLSIGFLLLLFGVKTRFVTFLTVPVSLSYFGLRYSYGMIWGLTAPFHMALLLGLFCDWGAALSFDARQKQTQPIPSGSYGLPIRISHAIISLCFLFTAVLKLKNCGLQWFGGGILSKHLAFRHYLVWLDPNGVFGDLWRTRSWLRETILAHSIVGSAFEIGTILFELTFFITFFKPRLIPWFIGAAFLFHLGIFLALPPLEGISYLPYYIACIPWERIFPSWRVEPSIQARPIPRPALAWATGFLGFLMIAVVFGNQGQGLLPRIIWPFVQPYMFAWPPPPKLTAARYVLIEHDREVESLSIAQLFHLHPRNVWMVDLRNQSHRAAITRAAALYRCEHAIAADGFVIERRTWSYETAARAYPTGKLPMPNEASVIERQPLPACNML